MSLIGASTLLLVLRHFCYDVGRHVFDRCFDTPASAMTLLLRGKTHSNQCFGTPGSAMTLLLRGQARSDQCFDTSASAMTLLLHGHARSDQCFDTSALCYDTSVLYSTFWYFLYCVLLISYYWSR